MVELRDTITLREAREVLEKYYYTETPLPSNEEFSKMYNLKPEALDSLFKKLDFCSHYPDAMGIDFIFNYFKD
ncbi:MAG: hypothetical protein LBS48_02595 [Treponema sp.]|jgi:hypothetical protein|nr:hypothetical protein [Treponema sp.]